VLWPLLISVSAEGKKKGREETVYNLFLAMYCISCSFSLLLIFPESYLSLEEKRGRGGEKRREKGRRVLGSVGWPCTAKRKCGAFAATEG